MKVLKSHNTCRWKCKENLWCCHSFLGWSCCAYFLALDQTSGCESKTRSLESFVLSTFCKNGSPVPCLDVLCDWVGSASSLDCASNTFWSFSSHLCSWEASDPVAPLVCTNIWLNWPGWYWFGTVRCLWAGTDRLCEPQVIAAARSWSVQLCAPAVHLP